MHPDAYSFCASLVEKTGAYDDVIIEGLDVGGANINGTARTLWPRTNWTVIDKNPGDDVDIVADITTTGGIQTVDNYFFDVKELNVEVVSQKLDLVLCTEVLEHEPQWREVVEFCVYMLGAGGHFVLTCAGPNREPHRPDGDPLDDPTSVYYENILPNSLIECLIKTPGLLIRSFVYNPDVGDIYVYGYKGW